MMKTTIAFIILLLLPISAQDTQQKITKAYNIALKEIEKENFDQAEKYLNAILKAAPSHGNARFQLINMKKYREGAINSGSKKQIKDVTIGKIDFVDVPLEEAIEGFRILVDQSNGDSPAPNIVVLDPQGKLTNNNVSIPLSGIPAETALNYMADSAKARIKFSKEMIQLLPSQ